MGALLIYLRRHPWQRRAVTALLTLCLATTAGLLGYQYFRDYMIIRHLGDPDRRIRAAAIDRAVVAGHEYPSMIGHLENALDTGDDIKFAAVATVLNRLGAMNALRRDPIRMDRFWAVQMEAASTAAETQVAVTTRQVLLHSLLLGGRDNGYVRRALAAAMRDKTREVLVGCALLAGRLGEDATLETLLKDPSPAVQAAAALDAGLAGRKHLAPAVAAMWTRASDPAPVSAGALALALLAPKEHAAAICARLGATKEADLRERLLCVMTVLADDNARAAVREAVTAGAGGGYPSPMTMEAAGRLGVVEAGPAIRRVLTDSLKPESTVLEMQLIAALQAAYDLDLPVRGETYKVIETLWCDKRPLTLMAACRLMGRQLFVDQPAGDKLPSVKACLSLLRQAAMYSAAPASQPASGPAVPAITTPMPSAAAALALWQADDEIAQEYVRNSAAETSTLPGDYLAWHIAREGRHVAPTSRPATPQALQRERMALGLAMAPAVDAPPRLRVYNDEERSTGAMLLALSARSPEEKTTAIARLRQRLDGGRLAGETDFYVKGAMQCALLILGERDMLTPVQNLLLTGEFPQRRSVTALCAAADWGALDWMLLNPQMKTEDLYYLLVGKDMAEVLEASVPGLPRINRHGGERLLEWQVRIVQDYYAIHRHRVGLGLSRGND